MPHVSKRKLNPKAHQELVKALEIVIARTKNKDEISKLFSSLLTETEKLMLAKRMAMIILINNGSSDSEISMKLNVTRETAGRTRLLYSKYFVNSSFLVLSSLLS